MDKRATKKVSMLLPIRIPACSSGRKNLKLAGFVPGLQSNSSSRGIISLRLLCSPQKNAPFAFRKRPFCAFRSEVTASLLL